MQNDQEMTRWLFRLIIADETYSEILAMLAKAERGKRVDALRNYFNMKSSIARGTVTFNDMVVASLLLQIDYKLLLDLIINHFAGIPEVRDASEK